MVFVLATPGKVILSLRLGRVRHGGGELKVYLGINMEIELESRILLMGATFERKEVTLF